MVIFCTFYLIVKKSVDYYYYYYFIMRSYCNNYMPNFETFEGGTEWVSFRASQFSASVPIHLFLWDSKFNYHRIKSHTGKSPRLTNVIVLVCIIVIFIITLTTP